MCDVIFFSKFYWRPFWKGAGSWINWNPLDYFVVTGQDDVKNVIKRKGHRACFHVTVLTDIVILETFANLSAQQITPNIFQCSTLLYHTEYDSL